MWGSERHVPVKKLGSTSWPPYEERPQVSSGAFSSFAAGRSPAPRARPEPWSARLDLDDLTGLDLDRLHESA